MAEDLSVGDGIVGEYQTYEDYLDSQITPIDIYYLEDEDLARQLVVRTPTTRLCLHAASGGACIAPMSRLPLLR